MDSMDRLSETPPREHSLGVRDEKQAHRAQDASRLSLGDPTKLAKIVIDRVRHLRDFKSLCRSLATDGKG
jgi:hypothetical protein